MKEKESKTEKRQRAAAIVAALEQRYPIAACTLSYEDGWQLMVAVRLAAQCTDARVDLVTEQLFAEFPTARALADAPYERVYEMVRPCGLGATKARDILASMKLLCDEYGGILPDDIDTLLRFPGVGRKSANLMVGDIYGKPAIVCDTHCIRICGLLGLTDSKNPAVVEKQLRELIQPEKGNDFCHRLVLHGRACCVARRPNCAACCLRSLCCFAARQGGENAAGPCNAGRGAV